MRRLGTVRASTGAPMGHTRRHLERHAPVRRRHARPDMTTDQPSVAAGPRTLQWPRLGNARDLGGLPTVHGRSTARRALVRADSLKGLTPEGASLIRAYGVCTVIDLRLHGEATSPVESVTWRRVPLVPSVPHPAHRRLRAHP